MSKTMEHRIDLEAVRAKYDAERDKRIRKDHNEQYVAIEGELAHFEDDPYVVERIERAPIQNRSL